MNARVNRPAMGIATETSHNNKALYRKLLDSFAMNKVEAAVSSLFHESAKVNASHPINEAQDGDGYLHNIIAPIFASFEGCTRQNYIVLGGEYLGSEWVTSTGYFHGHFSKPFFGIPASGKLAYLRFGEFHRMENGSIVESHVFLGFAELIIALGLWPLEESRGYEGVVPGPATHDGIVDGPSDRIASRASADLVEAMLKSLQQHTKHGGPTGTTRWCGTGLAGLAVMLLLMHSPLSNNRLSRPLRDGVTAAKLASNMLARTVSPVTGTMHS